MKLDAGKVIGVGLIASYVAAFAGVMYMNSKQAAPSESSAPIAGRRRRFRGLGSITPMPRDIRDVPFNLLRSEAPVDSPSTIQALEQYISEQPEVAAMLPQEMAFTRWKQNGGVFAANMSSLMDAVQMRQPLMSKLDMTTSYVPRFPIREAASSMNELPWGGEPYEVPVSRGIPQQPGLSPYQLQQYADSVPHFVENPEYVTPEQYPEAPTEFGQTYQMQWGDNNNMRWIPRS